MALGGYGNGWKFPILFAGLMLNDAGMLAPRQFVTNLWGGKVYSFGEDGHTYYGVGGRPMWGADGVATGYVQPYFANNDFRDPLGVAEIDAPPGFPNITNGGYRLCCTSSTWVGEALSARILGLQAAWGHQAWFNYVDRWIADKYTGPVGFTLYGSSFVKSVWTTYRTSYP